MSNLESNLLGRETRAYLFLTSLVMCGMVGSMMTAQKITHIWIDFPCGVIVFATMTYPIVDCICELWGKNAARQALCVGLFSQFLIIVILNFTIALPSASFWQHQEEFSLIFSNGSKVVAASLVAFTIAQVLDIAVFQKIKTLSQGKWLWLRTNVSVYLGQTIDTTIFVNIVFYDLPQKWTLLMTILIVKIILSFLMTPVVYLIVNSVNRYLNYQTQAFSYA